LSKNLNSAPSNIKRKENYCYKKYKSNLRRKNDAYLDPESIVSEK
jgi:hypothetical protein